MSLNLRQIAAATAILAVISLTACSPSSETNSTNSLDPNTPPPIHATAMPRSVNPTFSATDSPSLPSASPATGPIITHLVSRQGTITIHASNAGPRYSITDTEDQSLAASLTAQQLRNQFPEFHRFIRSTLATNKLPKEDESQKTNEDDNFLWNDASLGAPDFYPDPIGTDIHIESTPHIINPVFNGYE